MKESDLIKEVRAEIIAAQTEAHAAEKALHEAFITKLEADIQLTRKCTRVNRRETDKVKLLAFKEKRHNTTFLYFPKRVLIITSIVAGKIQITQKTETIVFELSHNRLSREMRMVGNFSNLRTIKRENALFRLDTHANTLTKI